MNVQYTRIERRRKDHTEGQIKYMIGRGWKVEFVDGKEPIDTCEVCGLPIMDQNDLDQDREGISWHKSCQTENGG